jgi:hypothetical protein
MYPLEGQKTDIAALNKVNPFHIYYSSKISIVGDCGERSTNFNVEKKS